jgi:HEAT repeat protein
LPNIKLNKGETVVLEDDLKSLRSGVGGIAESAVKRLKISEDPRLVETMLSLLEDPVATARWGAAKVLGSLKNPQALEPLIAALNRENPSGAASSYYVSVAILEAIGSVGGEESLNILIGVLVDDTQDSSQNCVIRSAAAWALGRIGGDLAFKVLVDILNKPHHYKEEGERELRKAAVEALVEIGGDRVADALSARLSGPIPLPRFALLEGLIKLRDPRAAHDLILLASKCDKPTLVADDVARMLASLLTSTAEKMETEHLRAIADLKNFISLQRQTDDCGNVVGHAEQPMDIAYIRQLARQELLRRERGEPVPAPAEKPTTILVKCECGAQMDVDIKYAGCSGKCRICGRTVVVPMLSQ